MLVIDANLLLYAYDAGSPLHQHAKGWWEETLSAAEAVGLPWQTLVAFVRIGTHPRVFAQPMTLDEAIGHVSSWLQQPVAGPLVADEGHWEIYAELLRRGQARGNLASDANLAALALSHGATLCTTDRDFARFDGLSWTNPLEGS